MKLSVNDLLILCNCAIAAATQAGRAIQNSLGTDLDIIQKEGGDSLASQLVTEVDFLSEKIILETLKPTCEIYDLAVLAEESSDSGERFLKDYFWSIDPLDGTLPFTEGRSGFSVSIALVKSSGEPLIGVVYDPFSDTLYHAVKGRGAFKNGKVWKPENGNSFHLVCDRSFLRQERYSQIESSVRELAERHGCKDINVISHGGAAMNAMWVLENSPSCYFKFPKSQEGGGSLWDYSATAAIFSEIGAVATDIYGGSLDLNRLESSFMNHRGVIYASDSIIAKAVQKIYSEFSCS